MGGLGRMKTVLARGGHRVGRSRRVGVAEPPRALEADPVYAAPWLAAWAVWLLRPFGPSGRFVMAPFWTRRGKADSERRPRSDRHARRRRGL